MKQDWADGLNLDDAEWRFLNEPFGNLKNQQRVEASWLIEGMAVLAWAVGLAELPPFFTEINGARVGAAIGMFRSDARERIASSTLRNVDEIVMGAHAYGVLMWRLSELFKNPGPVDLYQRVSDPESRHLLVDGLEFHERDLAVEGVPLAEVPNDKLGMVGAIVFQRNRQFRWLLGFERCQVTVTTVS